MTPDVWLGEAPRASVLIPAHNESSVIRRCLTALLDGAATGEFEVCVVANGCTDDTVDRAARDGVRVLELPSAGKAAALQAGDEVLTCWPRIYLDADVELSTAAARALADHLGRAPVPSVAGVRPIFDLTGCSWPVCQFYAVWQELPWLTDDPVGNGVFAVTRSARQLFSTWPPVIADDLFAAQLVPSHHRRCLDEVSFLIRPPRRLGPLLAVRRRVILGNEELEILRRRGMLPPNASGRSTTAGSRASLMRLLRTRGRRVAALVYLAVVVLARVLARRARHRGQVTWDRDATSR